MHKADVSIRSIIGFCGACIAYYIGAGFATMQEVMQYNVSYGSRFFIVIAVYGAIYLYTNASFATNGNRLNLKRGGEIYKCYCGSKIGAAYDGFAAFFCFMCFIVMCGGANSTAVEQWGLRDGVGAFILSAAVIITALFGLEGILKALSLLGPIIIVFILLISAVSVLRGGSSIPDNLRAIDHASFQMHQVGGGNPLLAGASYGGFVIFFFAAFMAEIGAKNKLLEVNIGMVYSALFIMGTALLATLALVSYIHTTVSVDIPAIILARQIHPILAQALAIIIFFGIYTTSVPLLWTSVVKIADEGTKKYKIITVIAGLAGGAAASYLPYKGLVNILYGMNGYLGFTLLAFMIVHDIRVFVKRRKNG